MNAAPLPGRLEDPGDGGLLKIERVEQPGMSLLSSELPETSGRVAEVLVGLNDEVEAGQPLFRLDDALQQAGLAANRRAVTEVDAATQVAQAELAASDGLIRQAESAYREAIADLTTKEGLASRSANAVAVREIERLRLTVEGREGALEAAIANKATLQTRVAILLPAQKSRAEAALAEAEIELGKTVIRAGVSGRVQQFALRPGDIVNPMLRPAGVLVPSDAGRQAIVAGFDQIQSQVLKPGMFAEATCIGKSFSIIALAVAEVQDVIPSGQIRQGEQLVDIAQSGRPGTITAYLLPVYKGGLDGVPPGANCIVHAYSDHHHELEADDIGASRWLYLQMVDTVAVVKAALLRITALLLPVRTLVLTGH